MKKLIALVVCSVNFNCHYAFADDNQIELDAVKISAPAIDSRIVNHPATVETYTKQQIDETINATTSQQTLKYLPSFQVRERYIGDRNGPIATRTTGTLSSAQTLLFADGILLSNLLGNGFGFSPRWGLVSPEEISSVNILYGPFSSLYAGNSLGGVINLNTRMPTKFEAHASVQGFAQKFALYGTDKTTNGHHETFSVGNKINDVSFWFGLDHLENESQPMQFAQSTTPSTAAGGINVTGVFLDKSEKSANRATFAATAIDDTKQTNTKFKVAYDISPTIRAAYTLGLWDLDSTTKVDSYIKDAAGNAVYNSQVRFDGKRYDVIGIAPAKVEALHVMQAIDIKSNTKSLFDWQLTVSDYDYKKDKNSASRGANELVGNPATNRIGRVVDLDGTGWTVFDARGTLRPIDGHNDQHIIDFGYHIDHYQLHSETNNTADWGQGNKGALFASSVGNTQTQALYVQDKWQVNPQIALTIGARQEYWQASDGQNQATLGGVLKTSQYSNQSENRFSPKLSLSFEPNALSNQAWGYRASFGQAFRFPTVGELYQQVTSGTTLVQNNPDLKPEEVISAELTAERRFANGVVRASFFHESKFDALIVQTTSGTGCLGTQCTFIQNIDHVRTNGVEVSSEWQDAFVQGLDLLGSVTLTDAEIVRNSANPQLAGKKPIRIPNSMLKAVATYHQGNNVTYSVAARYSGRQYNAVDNSDNNPNTYGGASKFFFVDVKANFQFADRFTASVGVDNINNYKGYIFHPYPQRTGYLQIKFDY